jgi:hypothetical protein
MLDIMSSIVYIPDPESAFLMTKDFYTATVTDVSVRVTGR